MFVPVPTSAASRKSLEKTETCRATQETHVLTERATYLIHRHVGQESDNVS